MGGGCVWVLHLLESRDPHLAWGKRKLRIWLKVVVCAFSWPWCLASVWKLRANSPNSPHLRYLSLNRNPNRCLQGGKTVSEMALVNVIFESSRLARELLEFRICRLISAKQYTCFCQKQVGMDRNYDPSKLDMVVRHYIRSPDPLHMHGSNSDGVALGSKLTKPLQV